MVVWRKRVEKDLQLKILQMRENSISIRLQKSESLDSPAVSPSQAPSIASCVEYGREFSDDEMGYHSDREAGFVPYTRRRKVRGQSQKNSPYRQQGS